MQSIVNEIVSLQDKKSLLIYFLDLKTKIDKRKTNNLFAYTILSSLE